MGRWYNAFANSGRRNNAPAPRWNPQMQRREECADLPMDLNQLQDKFIHDLFVSEGLGAVIDEAEYGYAKCSMVIEPRHCNALGIPMGGTIFTLADFAFAVASNQNGRDVVTQASQITFLKSAKGKHLTAVARQIKDGKRVCFYEVVVSDELGTEVAFVTINGYVVRDQGDG